MQPFWGQRMMSLLKQRTAVIAIAAVLVSGVIGTIVAVAWTGPGIASIAIGQIGTTACSPGYYSSCTGNGGRPEYWCSDFAHWVWHKAGVNTDGLTPAAGSFGEYGPLRRTPAVGDAVLFGYNGAGYAQHVAIVVQVNSNGTIKSVGGDENGQSGGNWAATATVAEDGPYSGAVGYSSYMEMYLSGYVAPSGSGGADGGGGGTSGNAYTGPIVAPPGGANPPAGTTPPSTKRWVNTFGSAPGYAGGWTRVGTLYANTSNYVFCKEWGAKITDSAGNYNQWWMWTDLDTGGQGWVSAYYLALWGNDQANDNSGNVIPNCYGHGSGAVGKSGANPGPPGGAHQPAGTTLPTKYYWVSTFANATGYYGGWTAAGTLYANTNYVYCKQWGARISDSSGAYNHWWLWTDLDTGGSGWVSAYYLSNWGNDVAKDNYGNVIPNCWGNGSAPGASGTPSGSYSKYWVNTFAAAPGYNGSWNHVGTLYAGTNYVFCKIWGALVSDSAGNYNHFWLWTDLDTGGQGWVSAYYLSLWGNDVAKDNSGNVIPNC